MALRLSTGLRNKQLGIAINKITNGTFDTATTGWTAGGSTVAVLTVQDGIDSRDDVLRVAGDTTAGWAHQAVTVIPGHTYKVNWMSYVGTSANVKLNVGTTAGASDIYAGTANTDANWTSHTDYFTVPAGELTAYVSVHVSGNGLYAYYDSIELYDMSASYKDIFAGAEIRVYTGTQPATADDAPTGTLLVTIKENAGAGVTFDEAVDGVLSKASAETWTGTVVANGTAGWARLQTPHDLLSSNTTDERIDMAVGTSGAQMNFSSTTFAVDAVQTCTRFNITYPSR